MRNDSVEEDVAMMRLTECQPDEFSVSAVSENLYVTDRVKSLTSSTQ